MIASLMQKWRALSPLVRKRTLQGVGAWAICMTLLFGWLYLNAEKSRQAWLSAIPFAETMVVYQNADSLTESDHGSEVSNIPLGTNDETMPAPLAPVAKDQIGKIALIITGLGLASDITQAAIESFPAEVTLAFTPYSPRLEDWLEASLASHHQNLIALPMEPRNYPSDDPGPRALLSRAGNDENARNLAWAMRSGDKVIGAINFMGDRFLQDDRKVRLMLQSLQRSNQIFIDTTEPENLTVTLAAAELGAKVFKASITQTTPTTAAEIRRQLSRLEQIAHNQGTAIGVFTAYPAFIPVIKEWAESGLEKRNLKLIPTGDLAP